MAEVDPIRFKRLRWRCRRGTRELDRLLGRWLEDHAVAADESTLARFESLLACEDRDLQRWLLGYQTCEREDLRELIDAIRAKPHA